MTPHGNESSRLRAEVDCLKQLLEVQEQAVLEQSEHLESLILKLQQEHKALQTSEERIRCIIDAAPDAIVSVDRNGQIVEWNPQAEKVLGWSREEAIGSTVQSLIIPPRRRAEHAAGLVENDFVAAADRYTQTTAAHRDGHEFPIEITVARSGAENVGVATAFLRDITERKRAEDEMTRARDEAMKLCRLKSEFLSVVSHELRTPMNGINPVLELLLATELAPEQREYAGTIQSSAQSLLTVLNAILEFSAIEAETLVLEAAPVDLRLLVEEVVELFAAEAAKKNIGLTTRCAPAKTQHFFGDQRRIRQVLTNLVSNAVKFTEAGEILVSVEIALTSNEAASVSVTVTDSGIGIARDQLDHIFDKFTQADASGTRRYGGTGLGLAISARLVKLMGGSISVESRLGEGSSFCCTFPLSIRSGESAPHIEEPSNIRSQHAPSSNGRARILAVEDNAINQKVVVRLLEKLNCDVNLAANGREAIRMFTEHSYDLVIMDCQMPVMDGFEATTQIRARENPTSHIPIIALTASVMAENRERCMAVGMDDYLNKPVSVAQLKAMIERWVPASHLRSGTPLPRLDRSASITQPIEAVIRSILVIDDNPDAREIARLTLVAAGYAVTEAADGRTGLERARTENPDMILLDLMLPDCDGLDLVHALRKLNHSSKTRVVSFSAYPWKLAAARALGEAFHGHVEKPVDPTELIAALEELRLPS